MAFPFWALDLAEWDSCGIDDRVIIKEGKSNFVRGFTGNTTS
jgi:hypothetical protein